MNKIPYCSAPWTALHMAKNLMYGPCCHYMNFKMKDFPKTKKEIMNLFHSKEYVNLRKKLINKDIKGTPCENCLDLKYEHKAMQFYNKDLRFFSDEKLEIKKQIEQSYLSNKCEIEYAPIELFFLTSENCNLKCIFCTQNRNYTKYDFESFKSFINEYEKDDIDIIGLVGGETLLTTDSLKMLNYLASNKNLSQKTIQLVTNGLLVKNHFSLLKKFDNLNLIISVDGYENSYEYIRKNSSWSEFVENIDYLTENKKKSWKILFRYCIMKSSFKSIPDFIKFAKSKNLDIHFSPLFINELNIQKEENLFDFDIIEENLFFDEIDNILELDLKNMKNAVDSLNVAKRYFKDKKRELKQKRILLKKITENKLVIFGTGIYATNFYNNIPEENKDNILVFSDNDTKKHNSTVFSKKIINPKEILNYTNNVFIASKAFKQEIYAQLIEEYGDKINIIGLEYE